MIEKKVILIFGKRGSGKSYLADHLLKSYNRYLVYDVLGEYNEGVCFESLSDLADFWEKNLDREFRLIYRPLKPRDEFDAVCKLVLDCGDMTFMVEELDTFCSPQEMGDSFASIIQRGRHFNITFIGVSQRPFGINRVISSQAKEIYTFQHDEPRDLEYLSLYIGKEVEQIKTLKEYHFLKWLSRGSVTIQKV